MKEASGFETIEMRIEPASVCDAKQLGAVPWPREAVVVAVQRNGKSIIPRGNLVLQAGDEIVLLSERNVLSEVRKLCLANENKK